ncbi:MAG: Na+/H+ antiporter NhaA, partial [Bryobacteraceae bacterium]
MAKSPGIAAHTPIVGLVRPFQEFAARETSGGVLLLVCTLVALVWENSPWAESYSALWHTRFSIGVGGFHLTGDLHFCVNEVLMTVFFFVVGLEIKRELLSGELASPRAAALPILAALGGVVVPALFYTALNGGGPGAPGWGIPMATDIAFAIGVTALLGNRVPLGLKVFLTALAIVDDIAAVLVIAIFYTAGLSWAALGLAAACLTILLAANRLGVRHPLLYALLGLAMWGAMLKSGVHATIAGVLLAFTIPSRTAIDPRDFLRHGRAVLDRLERVMRTLPAAAGDHERQSAIEALENSCEKAQAPLIRLERWLHPWVSFVIMPLFALANAGVPLSGSLPEVIAQPITLGVMVGLVLGKPAGVTLAAWLAVRAGAASLPKNVSWMQIHG